MCSRRETVTDGRATRSGPHERSMRRGLPSMGRPCRPRPPGRDLGTVPRAGCLLDLDRFGGGAPTRLRPAGLANANLWTIVPGGRLVGPSFAGPRLTGHIAERVRFVPRRPIHCTSEPRSEHLQKSIQTRSRCTPHRGGVGVLDALPSRPHGARPDRVPIMLGLVFGGLFLMVCPAWFVGDYLRDSKSGDG